MKDNNEKLIRFFKALANEERIEIVKLLKKNKEMFAQDVEKYFYLEQSTTSHHLNTLKKAGITKSRKEGRNIYYAIDFEGFQKLWTTFEKIINR
ncbi:MAG: helix-turn-helix transcriptional regulator [Candidatus Margulisbacteria bacterium]|nr:helix-turn-helix transcriptional regulator [Candidatus Margulisiibacteriota bacterium]